jgi:hypothetical protein
MLAFSPVVVRPSASVTLAPYSVGSVFHFLHHHHHHHRYHQQRCAMTRIK